MDFKDLLRKRRMVRVFTDEPVPDDVLQRLLATAQRDRYTPAYDWSARNLPPGGSR